MTFYAIRHKPTEWYMPVGGRTHTKDKPTKDCIPRLFKRKSDATLALIWWLEGVSFSVYDNDDEYIKTTKMPDRKIEEMEIIQVTIVEHTYGDNKA